MPREGRSSGADGVDEPTCLPSGIFLICENKVSFIVEPGGCPVSLHIINTSSPTQTINISALKLDSVTFAPQNVLTNICSEDAYHYGFNGKMKDNEWAGVGNHTTAMFWEYGTREARRWNRDPKSNPSVSSYSILANSPIWFKDPFGDSSAYDSKGNKIYYDPKDAPFS